MSYKDPSTEWIKVTERSPQVFLVELSRKPVNAFNVKFWKEFRQVFERLSNDVPDVRAVVLSSAFPRIFTAGLDLNDASSIGASQTANTEPARKALSTRPFIFEFQNAITIVERCLFPVIIALSGTVVGLGVDMLAACDIRYASEDTRFSIKEVDIGLAADIGSLAYLPKITGNHSLLRELAYTGRFFSADEAQQLGLLSRVVKGSKEDVVREAIELAKAIAGKSPIAVAGTKRLITHARDHSVGENLEYTVTWNQGALQTQDIIETLEATKGKRKPVFRPLNSVLTKL